MLIISSWPEIFFCFLYADSPKELIYHLHQYRQDILLVASDCRGVYQDLKVVGKQKYERTYIYPKECVECLTSQVTKVTSDDITVMT